MSTATSTLPSFASCRDSRSRFTNAWAASDEMPVETLTYAALGERLNAASLGAPGGVRGVRGLLVMISHFWGLPSPSGAMLAPVRRKATALSYCSATMREF
jgi:hypothetical protein